MTIYYHPKPPTVHSPHPMSREMNDSCYLLSIEHPVTTTTLSQITQEGNQHIHVSHYPGQIHDPLPTSLIVMDCATIIPSNIATWSWKSASLFIWWPTYPHINLNTDRKIINHIPPQRDVIHEPRAECHTPLNTTWCTPQRCSWSQPLSNPPIHRVTFHTD